MTYGVSFYEKRLAIHRNVNLRCSGTVITTE